MKLFILLIFLAPTPVFADWSKRDTNDFYNGCFNEFLEKTPQGKIKDPFKTYQLCECFAEVFEFYVPSYDLDKFVFFMDTPHGKELLRCK